MIISIENSEILVDGIPQGDASPELFQEVLDSTPNITIDPSVMDWFEDQVGPGQNLSLYFTWGPDFEDGVPELAEVY